MAQDRSGRDCEVDRVLLKAINAIAAKQDCEIVAADPEPGQNGTSRTRLFLKKNDELVGPINSGGWTTHPGDSYYLILYPGPNRPAELRWTKIGNKLHYQVSVGSRPTITDGGYEDDLANSNALAIIVEYFIHPEYGF